MVCTKVESLCDNYTHEIIIVMVDGDFSGNFRVRISSFFYRLLKRVWPNDDYVWYVVIKWGQVSCIWPYFMVSSLKEFLTKTSLKDLSIDKNLPYY